MTLLLTLLLKSLLVCAAAGILLFALRRSSAAARHLVCFWTLAALLALPLFSLSLPAWHLPVPASPLAPNPGGIGLSPAASPSQGLPPIFASVPPAAPQETVQDAKATSAASPGVPSVTPTPAPPELGVGGLLAFYLLGLLLASSRPLLGLWGIRRLGRHCAAVSDAPTLGIFDDCAQTLGLQTPRLCRADVPVPMTWGWRRPVIVLPLTSVNWPEDRLRSVLLHEMAHVKRRDWPGHRMADFACAVYWFHPLVWLIAHRLRAESEAACDDLVLASGIPAPDYARHLLEIAQTLPPVSRSPHSAIAMAQTSRIERRLLMLLDTTQSRRTLTRRVLLAVLIPSAAALLTLAALRPGVKAQAGPAMPVPLASTPASSMTPPLPKMMLTNMEVDGKPLLAGMTTADKPGSPWWSPNGALLPAPVYDTSINRSMNDAVQERNINNTLVPLNNVIFAFRLPAAAQGVTFQYKLPGVSSSSNGAWPGKRQGDAGRTEGQMFADTGGARIICAAFPTTLKKTNMQVGIAAGAWETAVSRTTGPSGGNGTSSATSSSLFILSAPDETAKGLLLTLTTNSTDDIRIVAIDNRGQTLFPTNIGGNSSSNGTNNLDQTMAYFSQPVSQIKEFRVETRPFQWIEFKDVALKPVQ